MHYKLTKEILKISVADLWDQAKKEWTFSHAFQSDQPQTCLCGHFPIKNICVIENKNNNQVTEVGNCCVTKFMGIDEGNKIFGSINRLKEDINKSMSPDVVEYLYEKQVLSDFEYEFYNDISKKRKLSDKQIEIKRRINHKLLSFTSNETNSALTKVSRVLEWSKDNPWFKTDFIKSLEKSCKRNGALTEKQEKALDNLITKLKIG